MQKRQELYRGKAKTVWTTDDPQLLVMEYRNDTSAFDGVKLAQLDRKGEVNNKINAHIMGLLEAAGVACHFVKLLDEQHSLVKSLTMIPVECVVRNVAAGGMSKRLGIAEGTKLKHAVFEFFYKSDALHDPMINDSHITAFDWASEADIVAMKKLSFQVNEVLQRAFAQAGITLVDYKLEFGKLADGTLVLGDEFTPDGCRLWDAQTGEKMDKDRFRRDLGDVVHYYLEVGKRLGMKNL
ncbi:MAG: hypothetical protein RLZZ502_226 [Pseudomonadota bacterium]|jgi:phosphoribosylaminoimidazole-succinocarboxamide synthase